MAKAEQEDIPYSALSPEQRRRYDLLLAGLDLLDQAIAVFDATPRLVTWNKAMLRLLDFPESMVRVGTPFEDFARFNAERGEYGPGDVDALVRERVAAARSFQPHYVERARPNGRILAVRGVPIPNLGFVSLWTDITEQREQTEQINTLLREVNHRSKNMLAKVQALARSSIEGDPELVKRFEERVSGLSVNQDILVSRDWREVPVDELVRMQLHFIDQYGDRVVRSGPDVALIPRAAEILGMALHELATNSLKYGSLSVAEGTVEIAWECLATHLRITWRESGGPRVMKPSRRGFGSQLIEDIPRRALGGDVRHTFEEAGIVWELTMDNSNLADSARLVP